MTATRPNVTHVLVEVAGRIARMTNRLILDDHADGTGSRLPVPGDGAHRPGKIVRDEIHARNNARTATGTTKWSGLLMEAAVEAHASDDVDELRDALLQAAALAVAWVETIDRRGTPEHPACDDQDPDVGTTDPRSQLLALLDDVTVQNTAHLMARVDVGKARRTGLNEHLEQALTRAQAASKAVTAAELRLRAAILRHTAPTQAG